MKRSSVARRQFLKSSLAALGAGAVAARSDAQGTKNALPSNTVTVGWVGAGPQGTGVIRGFMGNADVRVLAVCDVDARRREAAKALVDKQYDNADCRVYNDFRELMARDDIDAVMIASPDHWHVLHAMEAARNRKDMYVEKPLGLSIREGQALRDAVNARGCVFQFGTQQRSSWQFRHACELALNGRLGKLHTITVGSPASVSSPLYPEMPVPDWLDYDLWLGPAPWQPYTENRIVNNHWWHISDYALGFVAGWGIHNLDIAQWGNGTELTGTVEMAGFGEFPSDGLCNCATGWKIEGKWKNGVRLVYLDDKRFRNGILFEGADGSVFVNRETIEAKPEYLVKETLSPSEIHLPASKDHVRNFLDCVKTRARTLCPIDVAVRSDTLCHLSDIAMRLGRKVRWDPDGEVFLDDDDANRMLGRSMRAPWRL